MENDIITLFVLCENGENCDGVPQFSEHETDIFAEIQSVKRTEFYMANRNGIDLALAAVINLMDFEEAAVETEGGKIYPSQVGYEGIRYRIVRSYTKDKHKMELVLQKLS